MVKINFSQIPNVRALFKRHFFAGLLVVIPLGVIVWIVAAALRTLWRLHELLPESWRPEEVLSNPSLAVLVNLLLTLALAAFVALGVSFLGWVSKQVLGRQLLGYIGELIQRIPVIRTVYSALDQLLRTLASGGGKQFSRVVYVEYPRKEMWTLAFVTGEARGFSESSTQHGPKKMIGLYVPTTPNPTSGFYLIVAESEVRESHLRVEDAFKTILSLGIAQGEDHAERRP